MAEAGSLGWGGLAEGELGFEQDASEGGVEFALQDGGCGGARGDQILRTSGEGAASLADDAGGAGQSEVEFEDEGATGVLVEEVGGSRVGGGQALVEEDEGEVLAAQKGERGTAAGGGVELDVEFRTEGIRDGLGGGFGGDEEKGGGLGCFRGGAG